MRGAPPDSGLPLVAGMARCRARPDQTDSGLGCIEIASAPRASNDSHAMAPGGHPARRANRAPRRALPAGRENNGAAPTQDATRKPQGLRKGSPGMTRDEA